MATKERPILFSAPMVLAILAGQKTQTRRVMKPQPAPWIEEFGFSPLTPPGSIEGRGVHEGQAASKFYPCPYGQVGDRLWVRETLKEKRGTWHYAADGAPVQLLADGPRVSAMIVWAHHKESDTCVSIHMPRWASRIALVVTDVRVQRLDAIIDDDARAEGVTPVDYAKDDLGHGGHVLAFKRLWNTINGQRAPWASNPFVWAITFRLEVP